MNVPPYGDTYKRVLQPFANLRVTAKYTPEMRVYISAGGFWNYTSAGMIWVEYDGGNSPTITAPAGNAKWVIITMNTSGSIVLIDGDYSAHPVVPTIPRGRIPLAAVYVQSSSVKITNDMIFDVRPTGFDMTPKSHIDLENTSTAGCHPIAAITSLQDTIDTLATITSVTSGLATKADVGGTSETTFKLNQDQTGTPSSDVYLEVERGSSTNVNLKWNETDDQWEYTDDGSTYVALNTLYINDGTQDILIKTYDQAAEPTLDTDQKACFWIDSDDSDKVYIVFRRGDRDQVKIQLT